MLCGGGKCGEDDDDDARATGDELFDDAEDCDDADEEEMIRGFSAEPAGAG